MKMMILALVIAAAFVVPASFIANSDSVDGTDDASLLLAENDSMESSTLLVSDEMTEYELPTNITESITIPEGYYVVFKSNYVMSEDAWIYFEAGSELRFEASEQFSIVARDNCGICMEEGSYFTAAWGDDMYSMLIDEEEAVGFTGQLDYVVGLVILPDTKITLNLRIMDTSKITYNGMILNFNGDLTVRAEFKVSGDISSLVDGIAEADFFANGNMTVECNEIELEIGETEISAENVSYLYDVTFATPKNLGTDYAQFTITGSDKMDLNAIGLKADISDSATLVVKMYIDDYASLNDIEIAGSAESIINIKDLDAEDEIIVKDASITNTFDFTGDSLATTKIDIGYLQIPYTVKDEDGTMVLEDLAFSSKYSFKLNTLGDILSFQNFKNIYTYITEDFVAEDAEQYIYDYFYPQLIVFCPDCHDMIDSLIKSTIADLPEESVLPLGAICGFFNHMAAEKMVNLQMAYENILRNTEDGDFIQYMIGCQKFMMSVGFGYEVFVPPTITLDSQLNIGSIIYSDGVDFASVNGFYYMATASVINDELATSLNVGYQKAFCNMLESGKNLDIYLPAANLSISTEGQTIAVTILTEGDFSYRNDLLDLDIQGEDLYFKFSMSEALGHFNSESTIKIGKLFADNNLNYMEIDDLVCTDRTKIDVPIDSISDVIRIYFAVTTHEFPGVPTDPFGVFDLMKEYAGVVAEAVDADVKEITIQNANEMYCEHMAVRLSDKIFGEATINGFGMTEIFGIYQGDVECSAYIHMKDAEIDYHSDNSSNHVEITNLHSNTELVADNHLLFELNGSILFADGETTEMEDITILEKADLSLDIYPDTFGTVYEIQKFDGSLRMFERGIWADFGNVAYDTETGDVKAGNVKVSGCDALPGSTMESVSGTIKDVVIYTNDEMRFVCSGYDLNASMHNGSIHMKVNDGGSGKAIYDVDGVVFFDDCHKNSLLSRLMYLNGGTTVQTTDIKGDGMLVTSLATSGVPYTGVLYVNQGYLTEDLILALDVQNAAFGFENGKITLRAFDGYTLDPQSYVGFTIKDGYVVIDPAIIEAKRGTLSANAYGETRELTVDGEKYSVVRGTVFELPVDPDFLYMADSHGNKWGHTKDGTWYLNYVFDHDLDLTSVNVRFVTPAIDATTYSPTNDVVFYMPDEYDYVEYKLPCGALIVFEDQSLAGALIKLSVRERTYDGHPAFEIECNVPMFAYLPVADTESTLFHVVNNTGIPVQGTYYVDDDGTLMYLTKLTTYSTYYFDSHVEYSKGYVYGASFVIVLILVLVLGGHFVWKSRKSH